MKKFNKEKQLKRLHNKNNNQNIKKVSIVLSIAILIGAIIYFSFARFESVVSFKLINGSTADPQRSIITNMTLLYNNGSTDLAYDGTASIGTEGTEDNNLRYIGANPRNYVYFNCTTTDHSQMNDKTCEKWRIIGAFNNIEDENGASATRIKIMRDNSLGDYSWDSSVGKINSGMGINQWSATENYEGSDLMRELNTDYLGNVTVGTDGKWYNDEKDSKNADMPSTTLNENAQNMIETVKWNLGTMLPLENFNFITKKIYSEERLDKPIRNCSTGSHCNDTVERTVYWTGKIALFYASDYGYSTSGGTTINRNDCLKTSLYSWKTDEFEDCRNNSWIQTDNFFEWTLTTYASKSYSSNVLRLSYDGGIDENLGNVAFGVKPTVYLKNDVKIVRGSGTQTNPYKLNI